MTTTRPGGAIDTLRAKAEAWLANDPDENDRAELQVVLDALPGSAADLADRFSGPLQFGTAGLRGPLRAGPAGMNLAVVRAAAAGLMHWLDEHDVPGPVAIGYDARYRSAEFAAETARVATGAGRRALVLPRPLPTPVLAHAVRALDAAAGVMVTASHNPPQDNGYKVYLGDAAGGLCGEGAQLVPPADAEIEAAIRDVGPLSRVPLGEPGKVLGDEIMASYVDGAAAVVERVAAEVTVAYTAMHGVGAAILADVLASAGFPAPLLVASQTEPDPDFPTVAFPNPEEPGAMDRAIALARDNRADLVIANDPDADRCAVAIADPAAPGGWRTLRGDEVGVLLADHLMRRGVRGRYATTIVSSQLLEKLCAARGMPYGETLTGFKWIVRAGAPGVPGRAVGGPAPLVYGYEEALGYCVAPDHVRDKDGISAAVLVCELAADLKATGATLLDRLDALATEFGVHATDQLSVRVDDLAQIGVAMRTLRAGPPPTLLDEPVTVVDDLLPVTDAVVLRTASTRVVVRPSGTEPKLKAYLEVVEPVTGGDVRAARGVAATGLAALRTEISTALGL
jgi:phosphomannomutase